MKTNRVKVNLQVTDPERFDHGYVFSGVLNLVHARYEELLGDVLPQAAGPAFHHAFISERDDSTYFTLVDPSDTYLRAAKDALGF